MCIGIGKDIEGGNGYISLSLTLPWSVLCTIARERSALALSLATVLQKHKGAKHLCLRGRETDHREYRGGPGCVSNTGNRPESVGLCQHQQPDTGVTLPITITITESQYNPQEISNNVCFLCTCYLVTMNTIIIMIKSVSNIYMNLKNTVGSVCLWVEMKRGMVDINKRVILPLGPDTL